MKLHAGKGAFMKARGDAENLSKVMKKIGELAGIETVCVITNMEQPIGRNVGNSLEIEEAIRALKGDMEEDVREIVFSLSSQIIRLAGISGDYDEIRQMINQSIDSGKAYQKFEELIANQGGDINYLNNIEEARYVVEVTTEEEGYIAELDAEKIGKTAIFLGAGRMKKEDDIDYTCGIVLEKKIGDYVSFGETLGYIHSNREEVISEVVERLKEAYTISDKEPDEYEHILGII